MIAIFKKCLALLIRGFFILTLVSFTLQAEREKQNMDHYIQEGMHSISSLVLYDYLKELCSDRYGGRLSGTEGYNLAAQWVSGLFEKMGVHPATAEKSY